MDVLVFLGLEGQLLSLQVQLLGLSSTSVMDGLSARMLTHTHTHTLTHAGTKEVPQAPDTTVCVLLGSLLLSFKECGCALSPPCTSVMVSGCSFCLYNACSVYFEFVESATCL